MKTTLILALSLAATACSALAQNDASWVASTGLDTNPCTRALPCQTFQRAHNQTNTNGVVTALDAADYGQVIVTKAITIDGAGVGKIISSGSTFAIHINVSNGLATILNLNVQVLGGVTTAIYAQSSAHIENVVVTGTFGGGIGVNGTGIAVSVKHVTIHGGNLGLFVGGGSATIRDSSFTTTGTGIQLGSEGVTPASALIERCELSFNQYTGLWVDGQGPGATVRISDSVITGNGTGVQTPNGGQIISFRTNMLAGNTVDGVIPFSTSLK